MKTLPIPRKDTFLFRHDWLGVFSISAAVLLTLLLAVRPLASPDLGYHLAYGQTFLQTGHIVEYNEFIYTLPADSRPEPGPGCWYDDQGKYHFVNANWLSQIILAVLWNSGGANALCLLQVGLVAGTFAFLLGVMKRLNLPYPLMAGGLLLVSMTAYMRFNLRPEVFSYLILSAQLFVLVRRRYTRLSIVTLVLLQLLLVNCHSYFMLGLAISGTFWIGRMIRFRRSPKSRRDAIYLGMALAGQFIACFLNPWGWKLAILPIETLLYIRANDLTTADTTGQGHPWSYIGEFVRPLEGRLLRLKATYAYMLVLGVAAAGSICALLRRRLDWFLLILGLTAVSYSMRRNIALGGFMIPPIALAGCYHSLKKLWRIRVAPPRRRRWSMAFSGTIFLISLFFSVNVITQQFYFNDRSEGRFGWGLSRLAIPLGACQWMSEHGRTNRIWTDFNKSSNFYFFTNPHPQVPILTNTWAFPPAVMREVLDFNAGFRPFAPAMDKYHFDTVAVQVDQITLPMAKQLAAMPDWSLAKLDGSFIVIARDLPESEAITQFNLDVPAYIPYLKSLDPLPAQGLYIGGLTLYHFGWHRPAAEIFAAATEEDPSYYEAWSMLGVCLAELGGQTGNRAVLQEAEKCFLNALQFRPDYEPAIRNLKLLQERK